MISFVKRIKANKARQLPITIPLFCKISALPFSLRQAPVESSRGVKPDAILKAPSSPQRMSCVRNGLGWHPFASPHAVQSVPDRKSEHQG
jgi:hypothetical protein